jgi:hypothetical protein
MTNKLIVIMKSLKVPKIKKILLYEIKLLVPNYSCLQNPWLGGYYPQIPVPSVLNRICWTPPPNKILGYATALNGIHLTDFNVETSLPRGTNLMFICCHADYHAVNMLRNTHTSNVSRHCIRVKQVLGIVMRVWSIVDKRTFAINFAITALVSTSLHPF